jgi:hypothetical protein
MRLRKKRTGELTTDFSEPLEVSLQPDLVEIKSAMTTCIQKIVGASRGFPRPEQSISQTFGGKFCYYDKIFATFSIFPLRSGPNFFYSVHEVHISILEFLHMMNLLGLTSAISMI